MQPTTAATNRPRKARRETARLSPRELAERELAAGTITGPQFERKRERVRRRECSATWADDVWEGKDRDYAAEARLRAAGHNAPRAFTGSGHAKVKCHRCGHLMPPTPYAKAKDEPCDECRADDNEDFYRGVQGSTHRKLIGAED